MKQKVGAFLIPSTLLTMMSFFGFLGCAIIQKNDASVYFNDPQVIKLCRAAISGNVRVIDELVAAGVDVNSRGEDGMTPLLFSLVGTNKSGLRRLMAHGADLNCMSIDSTTMPSSAVTNVRATTFNAAGFSPSTVKRFLKSDQMPETEQIYAFFVKGDLLSAVQDPFQNVAVKGAAGNRIPLANTEFRSPLERHGMGAVRTSMGLD